jgi:hypothetical protein
LPRLYVKRYVFRILTKIGQKLVNFTDIKFYESHLSVSRLVTYGQTEKHDEANNCIFRFYCERATKRQFTPILQPDVMAVYNAKSAAK